MNRPIAIDLFAGAGGFSLGLEQAGFDVPVAIEKDPIHAHTHRINFPGCHVIEKPIEVVSASEIRGFVGPSIDVLAGGPPCQGFSLGGKADPDDERRSLIFEFVRLVRQLKPKYFVMENVPGLRSGHSRALLEHAIALFKVAGYVVPEWQILNAKHFGVPQDRKRLIVMGARMDMPPIYLPSGTRSATVSVGAALDDIPSLTQRDAEQGFQLAPVWDAAQLSDYAREMRCLSAGSWHKGYPREYASGLLRNTQTSRHSREVLERFAKTPPGTREPISRFHRLNPGDVAPTLRAGTDSSRGRHTAPRPIHYREPRCLTVREMARLSSFPDWVRFDDRIWHGARQVGNAVPPALARALGDTVMQALQWRSEVAS